MAFQDPSLAHEACGSCPIRARAICARCDEDELGRLEQIKSYRSYAAGQTIVSAGERMEFVGSVVSGVAALSHTMEDGRRQMVGLLLPSDFAGRPGRSRAAYDVIAIADLVLCCFRRRAFEDLLAATPNLARRLLDMALDELDAAREWHLVLGRKTAREKVASLLRIIARRGGGAAGPGRPATTIDLPLTREQMADYLALTLETVSRQITGLRRDRLIAVTGRRGVTVLDMAGLAQAAGEEREGGYPV